MNTNIKVHFSKNGKDAQLTINRIEKKDEGYDRFEKIVGHVNNLKTHIDKVKRDATIADKDRYENVKDSLPLLTSHLKSLNDDSTKTIKKFQQECIETWGYTDINGNDIEYYAEKDSMISDCTYVIVNLSIPDVFFNFAKTKEESNQKKVKFRYNDNLFLLKIWDSAFLTNSADHGRQGCPVLLGGNFEDNIQCELPIKTDKTFNPFKFQFNDNIYYPMLLPNWTVCYFIAENDLEIKKYRNPNQKISITQPIQYDVTLGILFSRDIEVLALKES